MKPGHLHQLSQMKRETYNTLARRGFLDFLKRDVGTGVDRFRDQHVLAIVTFAYLRRIGLEAGAASAAIEHSWRDIMSVVGASPDPAKSELCGTRVNDLGIDDFWGWKHPKGRDADPVAHAAVDLRKTWEWLQPALAEYRKHPMSTTGDEDEEVA